MARKKLRFLLVIIGLFFCPVSQSGANPFCDDGFWESATGPSIKAARLAGHKLSDKCESYTAGFRAVQNLRDLTLLTDLFEAGLDLNFSEWNGYSLLNAAVFNGNTSLIVNLISLGADPNNKDNKGGTPLITACRFTNNRAVIETLIKMGADKDTKTENGQTCFYEALSSNGRYEIIRYLFDQNFRTTYENCKETYSLCDPAITAYLKGWHINFYGDETIELDTKIIDLLVSKGFDVNARSMELARYNSQVDSEQTFESTPLTTAIRLQNKAIIKSLLGHGANINQRRLINGKAIGDTPISDAISPVNKKRDHSLIAFLVFNGADLNVKSPDWRGTPVTDAIREDLETLSLLIDLGANIELRDDEGRTPLLYASENGYFDAVKFLLSKGANINATNKSGQNVLHLAARGDSLQTLEMLASYGANTKKIDDNGHNLLHIAAWKSSNPLMVRMLIQDYGFDVNSLASNEFRSTPLILATYDNSRVGVMVELLRNNADPNLSNSKGFSPIHAAAGASPGFGLGFSIPDNPVRIRHLLKAGANVNHQIQDTMETALHIAARHNIQQSIILLLEAGADPHLRDSDGYFPLEIYEQSGGSKESDYRGRGYWRLHDKHHG